MERKIIDTKYIGGKRISNIEETVSLADDTQFLGSLYMQKSNALNTLEKEPNNEYWKSEIIRIDKEIATYQAFVDGYTEEG